MFRLKKYERYRSRSLSVWRERLRIGTKVFFESGIWFKGQVIGIRNTVVSEFGKMVQVSYSGIDTDCSGDPRRVDGELWVPIESKRISSFTDRIHSKRHRRVLRMWDFPKFKTPKQKVAERVIKEEMAESERGQIGDDRVGR